MKTGKKGRPKKAIKKNLKETASFLATDEYWERPTNMKSKRRMLNKVVTTAFARKHPADAAAYGCRYIKEMLDWERMWQRVNGAPGCYHVQSTLNAAICEKLATESRFYELRSTRSPVDNSIQQIDTYPIFKTRKGGDVMKQLDGDKFLRKTPLLRSLVRCMVSDIFPEYPFVTVSLIKTREGIQESQWKECEFHTDLEWPQQRTIEESGKMPLKDWPIIVFVPLENEVRLDVKGRYRGDPVIQNGVVKTGEYSLLMPPGRRVTNSKKCPINQGALLVMDGRLEHATGMPIKFPTTSSRRLHFGMAKTYGTSFGQQE